MIEEEVPDLDVNAWYLDDGDLAGTKEQLQQAVDILLREGPPRGFVLSVRENVTFPSEPKSLVWCPVDLHGATGDADPLDRGVPRHRGLGVTVIGAPVGNEEMSEMSERGLAETGGQGGADHQPPPQHEGPPHGVLPTAQLPSTADSGHHPIPPPAPGVRPHHKGGSSPDSGQPCVRSAMAAGETACVNGWTGINGC